MTEALQRGVFLDYCSVDSGDLDRSALADSLPEWQWHDLTPADDTKILKVFVFGFFQLSFDATDSFVQVKVQKFCDRVRIPASDRVVRHGQGRTTVNDLHHFPIEWSVNVFHGVGNQVTIADNFEFPGNDDKRNGQQQNADDNRKKDRKSTGGREEF